MKQRSFSFGIRAKLFLGMAILVVGYGVSAAVVFISGARREQELAEAGAVVMPAALKTQSALFEFEACVKAFVDAIMTGDADTLAGAATLTAKVDQSMSEIAALAGGAQLSADVVAKIRRELSGLTARRAEVFQGMSAGDAAAREKAEALNATTTALRAQLTELSTAAARQLEARLAANTAATHRQRYANLVLAAVVILVGGTVVTLIIRAITRPLIRATVAVQRVAAGDLTVKVDYKSGDEIGQIIAALNAMVRDLAASIRTVAHNAGAFADSSRELSHVSTQVSANSEQTSAQVNVVASAADQVSKNIATVAAASEEVCASVRDIAGQASEAAKVASHAAGVAQHTTETITKLDESSVAIGNVIKVINTIADQTNLLALNATIEAARAGEAGKGFAVVANEVKELAKQTARATDEIRTKIEGIRDGTQGAVQAIKEIADVIARIDGIQTTIARSVEEQATTMNEISSNAAEVSRGSAEIAQNISNVSSAARSSSEAATSTASSAGQMVELVGRLNQVVARFKLDDECGAEPDPETRPLVGIDPPAVQHRDEARPAGKTAARARPGR